MLRQDHYKTSVYKTPFHERTSELNILNEWSRWKDYTVPTNYFRTDLEYFSVRNTTGVIDYTPMIKQKITGTDAAEFVNRFFTRDMNKIGINLFDIQTEETSLEEIFVKMARHIRQITGMKNLCLAC